MIVLTFLSGVSCHLKPKQNNLLTKEEEKDRERKPSPALGNFRSTNPLAPQEVYRFPQAILIVRFRYAHPKRIS